MKPHPDFVGREVPFGFALGPYRLRNLTEADLEEDYDNVMASAAVLKGVFGGTWPEGLTKDYDATDLHWHHREFTARRSFAWVIRDSTERYVGCAYLNPEIGATGKGEAVYWMIDMPDRIAQLESFGGLYLDWLKSILPAGYDLKVTSNLDIA
ncbi:MAG: hypothetical protein AAFQ64_16295 [Pseudomonadota bacterium]